jgi:hypothetical protein
MIQLPRWSTKEQWLDYYETLCEELILNGFDVEVNADNLKDIYLIYFTIGGSKQYRINYKQMMLDFYCVVQSITRTLDKWAFKELMNLERTILNNKNK